MKQEIKILENEFWYGGAVNDGYLFPLTRGADYEIDLTYNDSYNQENPLFVSNKGRYIWAEEGCKAAFHGDCITVEGEKVVLKECGKTLKEASLGAAKDLFSLCGKTPDGVAFRSPQYCSWIDMAQEQNQEGVLKYARSIVEAGLPTGILIIDDCWQEDYGVWEFHPGRFPDPKSMIDELHALGFFVMLWIVPYVSADSAVFRAHEYDETFMRDRDGQVLVTKWFNGYSAVLDFTKADARAWFAGEIARLRQKYGVDGFKLDGGDGQFLPKWQNGNLQNELYAETADDCVKELRACWKKGGMPYLQRLADKAHSWGVELHESKELGSYYSYGLSTVIPNMLTQGLLGYYYGCPDMVGGGLMGDFTKKPLDDELLIRSAQTSALMPMMQFSLALWKIGRNGVASACKKAVGVRQQFCDYVAELAKNASETGEPIVRYMEYEFPNEGMERVTQQFTLGDRYIVAPVTEKGATEKEVVFPSGKWKNVANGGVYEKGTYKIPSKLDDGILIFEKLGNSEV